ncbi:helix-turn-helix transcriptional regulator [Brevundimonas sp. G8]|uniref:helix-turn-helix transcriptional regulator n=1 Tax=Brevundimonas sp. G8 TaxID=1350776 RepID=UPI0012F3B86C|nr:hypothetical protein BREVUG8_110896 [Brevundimonas sp. G8]
MADRRPDRSDIPDLFAGIPEAARGRIVTGVILERVEPPTPVRPSRGRTTAIRSHSWGLEPGGPEDRLLPWPEVRKLVGFSRTTAWRMQRAGLFPGPVPVSPGRVGWWESELNAWKQERRSAEPVSVRAPGEGRRFSPPSAPRLPGMPRSTRALPSALPPMRSVSPPLPPPAAPARISRRRSRGPDPAQTDFGF